LPVLAPGELVASALSMAHFCQALWWRDSLGYARSNHRLGQWLLSFVAWVNARQTLEEHDWLARAEHAARERFSAGRLTVAGMARVAGVSRQLLHRSFRRLRGQSPSEFLQSLWLERAKMLLEQTDQPARQVAIACGFRFAGNFSREFRAHTGLTPLSWRRAHRR
jgi:transcriptional regulator GlxA family with amidase domain